MDPRSWSPFGVDTQVNSESLRVMFSLQASGLGLGTPGDEGAGYRGNLSMDLSVPRLRDKPPPPSLQQLGCPVHRDLPAKGQEHLDLHMHILASRKELLGKSFKTASPSHCIPQLSATCYWEGEGSLWAPTVLGINPETAGKRRAQLLDPFQGWGCLFIAHSRKGWAVGLRVDRPAQSLGPSLPRTIFPIHLSPSVSTDSVLKTPVAQ